MEEWRVSDLSQINELNKKCTYLYERKQITVGPLLTESVK